jgi:adenylate cyclase class IV
MRESHAATADEVELKAVVPDLAAARARLEAAGGALVFAGQLEDRRWDTPARRLTTADEMLRTRVATPFPGAPGAAHASLDYKGPTRRERGYKVREERSTPVGDAALVGLILSRAGFVVTREVDREIAQYRLDGAVVRFEVYPRLDVLVEVEGTPAAIERAITALGIPRAAFGAGRLTDFVADFERRTRTRAAVCRRELAGERPFRPEDDA